MTKEEKIKANAAIQAAIKERRIFIPKDYCGTINPDVVKKYKSDGYVPIFGDSYGPFSDSFFDESTYRIVFICKESYVKADLSEVGSVKYGGWDKAKTYGSCDWDKLGEDNVVLYRNMAKCSFALMTGREMRDNADDKELALKFFRENTAVINCNVFPLIMQPSLSDSVSSNDSLICEWSHINWNEIKRLIQLYDADIVIGGSTLTHLCDPNRSTLLDDPVTILNTDSLHTKLGNNGIIYYNDKSLYINCYHPSHTGFPKQIGTIRQIRDLWRKGEIVKIE